jgi:flavin reductase (DIM6/NTAB) family NADH-FMN oxidoreductase RutF
VSQPQDLTPETLRAAFSHFPSGIAAVCAQGADGPLGMAVSTFVPVSLDPPLIALCLQKSSRTWPNLRNRAQLGVSILAEQHEEAARALSMREGDRFATVRFRPHTGGDILIEECAAYFLCTLDQEVSAGDHLLALLRVQRIEVDDARGHPLVFHRSRFARLDAACA